MREIREVQHSDNWFVCTVTLGNEKDIEILMNYIHLTEPSGCVVQEISSQYNNPSR